MRAIGEQSPFVKGFVAVFGEYAWSTHISGKPNLELWRPRTAMTPKQLAAYIKEIEATYADEDGDREDSDFQRFMARVAAPPIAPS